MEDVVQRVYLMEISVVQLMKILHMRIYWKYERIYFLLLLIIIKKIYLKEIISLRKEKEQDKQTIKLLQEQMVCFYLFISIQLIFVFSINIPVKQTLDDEEIIINLEFFLSILSHVPFFFFSCIVSIVIYFYFLMLINVLVKIVNNFLSFISKVNIFLFFFSWDKLFLVHIGCLKKKEHHF
jgi:hypothetical protein